METYDELMKPWNCIQNVIIQNDQINKETNKWQTTILQNNTKNETSSSLPQKIKFEYENTETKVDNLNIKTTF